MEFGIEICVKRMIKRGKRENTEGIEQPNQVRIRTLGEKEAYKCLEVLKMDVIKPAMIKKKEEKRRNGYLRRTRKPLETNLCSRNFF